MTQPTTQSYINERRETNSLLAAHNVLSAWYINDQARQKLHQAIDNTTDPKTAQHLWQLLQAEPCTPGQCSCGRCL